jgi:hypothetical protein
MFSFFGLLCRELIVCKCTSSGCVKARESKVDELSISSTNIASDPVSSFRASAISVSAPTMIYKGEHIIIKQSLHTEIWNIHHKKNNLLIAPLLAV